MNPYKDGGPAHPLQNADYTYAYGGHPGMSLRDWFAGQTLTGYIAHLGAQNIHASKYAEECAAEAYAMADAMLIKRDES